MSEEDKKPDCHKCGYRRRVPGSAHSACGHPIVKGDETVNAPMAGLMAIFASVGRCAPPVAGDAAAQLNIKCNSEHAIASGWFNWPWNFDPTWLGNCGGFKPQKEVCEECSSSLECITGAENPEMIKSADCWKVS